jgi:glycosyltransferase involved in cell wall biosynthesis
VIKILAIIDYYIPGFKAGGPQRTLQYLVDSLGNEFEFRILTRDRDLGDADRYAEVRVDSWNPVGKSSVFYTPASRLSLTRLRRLLRDTAYDVLYLNSLFSPTFTQKILLLRRLGLLGKQPVILRPRGELNKGALAIKSGRKRAYLAATKLLGLYDGLIWHASTEHEVNDVRRHFGPRSRVIVAPNLSTAADAPQRPPREKTKGHLKLVFLSRISYKKNLAGALRMLGALQGRVEMNVYGPIEDAAYWSECQAIAESLPDHITVQYHGLVPPSRVGEIFGSHHLFLFPTFGENFGHVIFEALAAGCPIVLSDQTPWRGLQEKGCGWDFPLHEAEAFRSCLQECVDMDATQFNDLSRGARDCALHYARHSGGLEQNRQLFYTAIQTTM